MRLLIKDTAGATAIEYGLLAGLMAMVLVVIGHRIAVGIQADTNAVTSAMSSAHCAPCPVGATICPCKN